MKPALALTAAAIFGGLIGLGIAITHERLLGRPWYR